MSKSEAKHEETAEKQVKILLKRDCMIGEQIHQAGTTHIVAESVAKELCDKTFPAYEPFYGNKPEISGLHPEGDPLKRREIVRAVRTA